MQWSRSTLRLLCEQHLRPSRRGRGERCFATLLGVLLGVLKLASLHGQVDEHACLARAHFKHLPCLKLCCAMPPLEPTPLQATLRPEIQLLNRLLGAETQEQRQRVRAVQLWL